MARHSGLGRGLGALIPTGDSETINRGDSSIQVVEQSPFRTIDIDSLSANTYQPRKAIDSDQLKPLSASIKELGVLQPILVRHNSEPGETVYEIIAGERRWRAAKMAGLKQVPVIIKETSDITSLEQALVENLHRKDLNSVDEASAYRQLIDDFSLSHDEVGRRVGKSRTAVSNLLRLLKLAPRVQRLIVEDLLSEGHARALLGTEDEAFQYQLAERAIREGLSVRAVEEAVRMREHFAPTSNSPAGKKSARQQDPEVLEWQDRLTNTLNTRVSVTSGAKKGKISIEFADKDDLTRIASAISSAGSVDDQGIHAEHNEPNDDWNG